MNTSEELYMIAIAEEKTLRKAARKAGVSQPMLSKWLHSVEDELKVSLFSRVEGEMRPTEAGQIYLEGCREIVRLAGEAERELARTPDTPLPLLRFGGSTLPGEAVFVHIFQSLRHTYPEIRLEFVPGTGEELETALLHRRIQAALLLEPELSPAGFDFYPFRKEELVILLPKGRRGREARNYDKLPELLPPADPRLLQGVPLFLSSDPAYHFLLHILQNTALAGNLSFRSPQIPLLCALSESGQGASIVPRTYASLAPNCGVCAFSPRLFLHLGIGFPKDRVLSGPERELCRLAEEACREPLLQGGDD